MIAILLSTLLAAAGSPATEEAPPLRCDIGPIAESVGGNVWTVYACADGQTVVVVAADPNPAAPFVFIVAPDGDGVKLSGEGSGPASATDPAYEQLKSMSAADLAALYLKASAGK